MKSVRVQKYAMKLTHPVLSIDSCANGQHGVWRHTTHMSKNNYTIARNESVRVHICVAINAPSA